MIDTLALLSRLAPGLNLVEEFNLRLKHQDIRLISPMYIHHMEAHSIFPLTCRLYSVHIKHQSTLISSQSHGRWRGGG